MGLIYAAFGAPAASQFTKRPAGERHTPNFVAPDP